MQTFLISWLIPILLRSRIADRVHGVTSCLCASQVESPVLLLRHLSRILMHTAESDSLLTSLKLREISLGDTLTSALIAPAISILSGLMLTKTSEMLLNAMRAMCSLLRIL